MNVAFEPLLPIWALAVVALAVAAALALYLARAPRLAWPRAAAALLVLLTLAGPVQRAEIREQRDDIAIAIVDRSASMAIGSRRRDAERALAKLRAANDRVEWRVVEAAAEPGAGTALAAPIERAVANVPADRLGGVVVLTDGISRDAPRGGALPDGVPLHLIVAGARDLVDRRLVVEQVPPYSVVGQQAEIAIRVEELLEDGGGRVPVRIETSEGLVAEESVPVGETVRIALPVERRGRLDVALSVPERPGGEATLVNNRALARLNGVTDRLRVLLVSGVPYPGGRVWRDVFKSDPNVDLVHFTILRLPSSFDPTPPQDLALIPFPVEELFEERLDVFDLIIFDRFDMTELMSPVYFMRLAERVRQGGGLLVVAGKEFGERDSIAFTALGSILPARPTGQDSSAPYRPALTEIGRRHPVTAALPSAWGGTDWGRWSMLAGVDVMRGDTLMAGAGGRPLLTLSREGEGRVGLLASTDTWWWARAVDGAGPRDELLRRAAHWLMQEPDLDEEQLRVTGGRDSLDIRARGVAPPEAVTLHGPGGGTRPVALAPAGAGERRARLPAAQTGLYAVSDGPRRRFALVGDTAELSEVRPRERPLAEAARASGGGVFWLEDGMPDVRRRDAGGAMAGGGWLGIARRGGGALIAVRSAPLIPPALLLALTAALLGYAWWRERR